MRQSRARRNGRPTSFGVGWDNAAYLVDGRALFRFPRRRVATRLLERKIAILPMLARALLLAISAPSYVGRATEAYPYVFAGYDFIAGTAGCSVHLSHDARAALAQPLGTFLRALHGIDPAPLVTRGLPPDEIGRLDHARRMKLAHERVPSLTDDGNVANTGIAAETILRTVAWLDAHPPRTIALGERRCVHCDLYARHVVVGADLRAVGIIDWGDMHLGDPAIDLAIAHSMLPPDAHAAFRSAYGAISSEAWACAHACVPPCVPASLLPCAGSGAA